MYLKFAWRYFKAKKSANAINIIAWATVIVIAFATCCQILVLSVFNGFEGLVKSLYSSFYTDIKISPAKGKTFSLSAAQLNSLKNSDYAEAVSGVIEEKALLKNSDLQTFIHIKGVDDSYKFISGVPQKIVSGKYNIGTMDFPGIVAGVGVQSAVGMNTDTIYSPDEMTIVLPKKTSGNASIEDALSEGIVTGKGAFAIQQDFDNQYAITNIDFLRQQMGYTPNEYTCIEIKLKQSANEKEAIKKIKTLLGNGFSIQNRYQQNSSLFSTMQLEKWAIFAILTLILIIAAFNMVSALTMLVLEKNQDISVMQSLGMNPSGIMKIFLTEGVMLGIIGTVSGIILALLIAFLQIKFKLIELKGGTFLIDYFPIQVKIMDILLVALSAIAISLIAAWLPARKAAKKTISLRA